MIKVFSSQIKNKIPVATKKDLSNQLIFLQEYPSTPTPSINIPTEAAMTLIIISFIDPIKSNDELYTKIKGTI